MYSRQWGIREGGRQMARMGSMQHTYHKHSVCQMSLTQLGILEHNCEGQLP